MNLLKKVFKNKVNIKFNNPNVKLLNNQIIEKDVNSNLNQINDKSLVVIFGWLNGSEKNVNSYVKDWENKGFKTLTNYYPIIDMVIPPIMTPKSLLILDEINKIIKEDPNIDRIVFHVLSNGGAHYYSRILHFIENDQKYNHLHKYIKGSLLDSNPTNNTVGIKHAFSIVAPNIFIKQLLMKGFPIISILLSRDYKYFKSIHSPKNKWNHLFIYCKNDQIISYKDVNSTINNLKNNLGSEQLLIDSICFDESDHVFHKKNHKEIYYNKFDGFINKIK